MNRVHCLVKLQRVGGMFVMREGTLVAYEQSVNNPEQIVRSSCHIRDLIIVPRDKVSLKIPK